MCHDGSFVNCNDFSKFLSDFVSGAGTVLPEATLEFAEQCR
jgi:hypothetical protein